jgi:hypothetical protein
VVLRPQGMYLSFKLIEFCSPRTTHSYDSDRRVLVCNLHAAVGFHLLAYVLRGILSYVSQPLFLLVSYRLLDFSWVSSTRIRTEGNPLLRFSTSLSAGLIPFTPLLLELIMSEKSNLLASLTYLLMLYFLVWCCNKIPINAVKNKLIYLFVSCVRPKPLFWNTG